MGQRVKKPTNPTGPDPTRMLALEAYRKLATGQITQREFAEAGRAAPSPDQPSPWPKALGAFAIWGSLVVWLVWWVTT
jgi:hypothetical protein